MHKFHVPFSYLLLKFTLLTFLWCFFPAEIINKHQFPLRLQTTGRTPFSSQKKKKKQIRILHALTYWFRKQAERGAEGLQIKLKDYPYKKIHSCTSSGLVN